MRTVTVRMRLSQTYAIISHLEFQFPLKYREAMLKHTHYVLNAIDTGRMRC